MPFFSGYHLFLLYTPLPPRDVTMRDVAEKIGCPPFWKRLALAFSFSLFTRTPGDSWLCAECTTVVDASCEIACLH